MAKKIRVQFVRLKHMQDLPLPDYAHSGDSGVDLMAALDGGHYVMQPKSGAIIPCGFSVGLPDEYEIQIRPRSGLAAKNNITVLNTPGTIDQGYRGEIKVILYNHGNEPFRIDHGMKIAQAVLQKVPRLEFWEVDELDDTNRGTGGFGSTGL
jgi:dUTP pyrophosphatase